MTFNTSHVYFMDTDCPSKFEFKHPCQRFGIALNSSRISMSWNRHTPPDNAEIPDLLYQSHQVPPRPLTLLFDLMASQRNAANESILASHIAHLILLAVAELLTKPQPTITHPMDHNRLICDYMNENLGPKQACFESTVG